MKFMNDADDYDNLVCQMYKPFGHNTKEHGTGVFIILIKTFLYL